MLVEVHGNGSAIYARRIRPSRALTQESRLTFCMNEFMVLKVVHLPEILEVRATFKREHDDAQRLKEHRAKIGMGGTSKHTPSLGASNEPRIVHEARKRRALEVENEISKGPGGRGAASDSRLMKMFNNQKREETESRVARAIFSCGIPFNVVRSPY